MKTLREGTESPKEQDRRAAAAVAATAGSPLPPLSHPAGERTSEHGTRNRVARSILDHGPSTAADLAERLGLTQAAVRRHLDTLLADGIVEPRDQRVYGARGRGRPAKVFALTDCGRDAFDQAYDQLAAEALRWIAHSAGGGERGEAAVADFARARIAAQAARYAAELHDVPPKERAAALARALTQDGYAATARSAPGAPGEQLCQHHCPVAHTAEQFPQLCEAETEVFSQLLGTHVQRLATIAHGDGVCTTFIPRTAFIPHADRTAPREADATGSAGSKSPTTSKAGRNPA
ncbi:helix-turn-helix transcriptional regulator [Streptomyces polyrhachis]|uniref:Helix-turn-helix transcriptional regulator n=1 Tax=Streptomyces polyrhachis TaxID=1282885 RepID=A0ABW2GA86_9ACTN